MNRFLRIVQLFFFLLFIQFSLIGQDITHSYSVTRCEFNSKWTELSPFILPNGIAFVSNRDDEIGISRYSETKLEPFFKIYFSEKTSQGFKKPIKVEGEINGKFSEGPISFSSDGKSLFFTRNIPLATPLKSGKKAHFSIFEGQFEETRISNIVPFTHNKPDYSLGHPSLSPNNNLLIFSSDIPGGYGGTDLYVSYFREGNWSKPINLGKEINSTRNEVFPFVNADGKLFFASDGHNGLGGLDIYSVNYSNFEWKGVHNLGTPFNSTFDDFGYVESGDKTFGYFCSDREGGTKDDIFYFELSSFVFSECDTLKELNYCRTFYEEKSFNTDSLPLIYEWDFGDGQKKRGLEVNHCFEKPGKYVVNLNIIDLITNQLFMNEASYELEIEPIKGPYFSMPDTVSTGMQLNLDASKSQIPNATVIKYHWDIGDGTLVENVATTHAFKSPGDYFLRLGLSCKDSTTHASFNKCVVRKVFVKDQNLFKDQKKYSYKPYFQIRDKRGNVYKIQVATSKERLDLGAYYFKELGKVEEYYDRGIFGYTVGSYDRLEQTYPELKRVREKGFKEAIVIAMKENKVVSGVDSSFFVKLPTTFKFVRIVTIHGKVLDNNGKPVRTTIKLEELNTGIALDEFKTDSLTGKYTMELPIGKNYAYYIYQNGYFPFSNFIDLTKGNDLSEIRSDIYLVSLEKMTKDSLAVRVNNIFFYPDDFHLKPESIFELKRLATFLNKYKNTSIYIESHTDNLGDKYSKKILSQNRAEEVKKVLSDYGCNTDNIIIIAHGEGKPISLNPRLQHVNNRIEIRVREIL